MLSAPRASSCGEASIRARLCPYQASRSGLGLAADLGHRLQNGMSVLLHLRLGLYRANAPGARTRELQAERWSDLRYFIPRQRHVALSVASASEKCEATDAGVER